MPAAEEALETQMSLRPRTLLEFVSQDALKANLDVMIRSALHRGAVLEHILLSGPPGTGKTSLAHIIANEMNGAVKTIHAPTVVKPKDIIQTLAQLQAGDILFVDEIHRLPAAAEEILYPVMEDYQLHLMVGAETQARSMQIDLPQFTLIGATTRKGMLSRPLYDRFGADMTLTLYEAADLARLAIGKAGALGIELSNEAAGEIGRRARGTPRIALQLLRRVRDFAVAEGRLSVTREFAVMACTAAGVDERGLTSEDRLYLETMLDKFRGRPAGLSTLAALLAQDEETIEAGIEPYLLQLGLIERTARGRVLTGRGLKAAGAA